MKQHKRGKKSQKEVEQHFQREVDEWEITGVLSVWILHCWNCSLLRTHSHEVFLIISEMWNWAELVEMAMVTWKGAEGRCVRSERASKVLFRAKE